MTERELDLLTEAYIAALDAGDAATLDRIWERAASEPELEAYLYALDAEIDADDKLQAGRTAKPMIADAVRTHLPSAAIVEPGTGPVTVGDVARELLRHPPAGLPAEAHALNEALGQSSEALPENLGLSKLVAWAEPRFGRAVPAYWKAFRSAALKLEMRRASAEEYQLAARRGPKAEGPK
jgi:hypothetical protein